VGKIRDGRGSLNALLALNPLIVKRGWTPNSMEVLMEKSSINGGLKGKIQSNMEVLTINIH